MANSTPNTARALEAAVVSTLILLVPFAQSYLESNPHGHEIEMTLSAAVIAAVSFIKSFPQSSPSVAASVKDPEMSSFFSTVAKSLAGLFTKASSVEAVVVEDMQQSAELMSEFLGSGYAQIAKVSESGFDAAVVVVKLGTPLARQLHLE